MIASLKGTVARIGAGEIVLEVAGVGYLIHTTPKCLREIEVGSETKLNTSQIFREDQVSLFGFVDIRELEVFDLLRSVSGVGPKSALAVLSLLSVSQIAQAVASEADEVFRAVPGIGTKTAKLICLTLGGKLNHLSGGPAVPESENALAALLSLGWSEKQARAALAKVVGEDLTEQQLLKLALRQLAEMRAQI